LDFSSSLIYKIVKIFLKFLMMNFAILRKKFDLIIVGSGGAGLTAAISANDCGVKNIAVISKVFPTNSHTVAAKGGINSTLSNSNQDQWEWHAYDTIKSAAGLADEDSVEIMCKNSKDAILFLEKNGVVFSRNNLGEIDQRAYGGQTTEFGNGQIAKRACYAKDRTGHTILHTLNQMAIAKNIKIFSEFFVTDLIIKDQNSCHGCLAIDLNSGELVIFESKVLIIATGGYGQIYYNTTSSVICSGDGCALVFKEGLPLQDMEFVQFHPTGIAGQGFLITEACRGEGGYLLNAKQERFMKKYSTKMMELSSRDVVSQAMATEVKIGNGCGKDGNFLHLDLRHLSEEILTKRLPGVVDLVKKFLNIDVRKDLIPVSPSAHYTMGGIPTDINCQVIKLENGFDKKVSGLMAIGEAASISVHGANRLGCNSLLDLIVFGKIAGEKSAKQIADNKVGFSKDIEKIIEEKIKNISEIFSKNIEDNHISISHLKNLLKENNDKNLGVFRSEVFLEKGLDKIKEILTIFSKIGLKNKNLIWNEDLIAYFELENLLLNSLATNFAAINRKESRGAHYRSDFKSCDNKNFLYHSLVTIDDYSKSFKLNFSKRPPRKLNN
jgi:succinate dehydrogenase / fumarate reductase flavoprotein subunit